MLRAACADSNSTARLEDLTARFGQFEIERFYWLFVDQLCQRGCRVIASSAAFGAVLSASRSFVSCGMHCADSNSTARLAGLTVRFVQLENERVYRLFPTVDQPCQRGCRVIASNAAFGAVLSASRSFVSCVMHCAVQQKSRMTFVLCHNNVN